MKMDRKYQCHQSVFSDTHEHTHDHDHAHHDHECSSLSPEALDALVSSVDINGMQRTPIRIMAMDCPTEERMIQKKLGHMPEVVHLEFNLIQRVLTVDHQANSLPLILAAIQELGFEPILGKEGEKVERSSQRSWWSLVAAGIFAFFAEVLEWLDFSVYWVAFLAILAICLCGMSTYKKGLLALKNGHLNINALMSLAVTGALLIGVWPEAAMVMVLFNLAERIEARALEGARHAISDLLSLNPETSWVKQASGDYSEEKTERIALGAVVRVLPGEKIGLDGQVLNGQSTVNQAPITGESLPVEKSQGDPVYAGTINQMGLLEYQVTAQAKDSTLSRIIQSLEEAQTHKAPTQRFVDQFARIYTPIVVALAALLAVIPPLFDGMWLDWVYKALVLLVIACPCALVISTPISIVSGLSCAARLGILLKGGVYLEKGHTLKILALDKTGTITSGQPKLTDSMVLQGDETQNMALALSICMQSDHPVSLAIAEALKERDIKAYPVTHFEALLGRGTTALIDGKTYYLGNHRLVHEIDCCFPELERRLEALESQGKTVIMLIHDKVILAVFAVADKIKKSSREAIESLHDLGVKTVMLTGDNQHTGLAIAAEVGIDEVLGEQLPQDKLNAIEKLSKDGVVAMVGDGINDAPALARADMGFAMGGIGSDTAIETADVVLMDDDLRKIPQFIQLSSKVHRILIQNMALALGIKGFFLGITVLGMATMWMAVFADVGTSLLVVANGLRLLGKKHIH